MGCCEGGDVLVCCAAGGTAYSARAGRETAGVEVQHSFRPSLQTLAGLSGNPGTGARIR